LGQAFSRAPWIKRLTRIRERSQRWVCSKGLLFH